MSPTLLGATEAGATGTAGQRLLARSLSTFSDLRGVSYRSTASSGSYSDVVTASVGRTGGTSSVVIRKGKLSGHVWIVLMSQTAYFKGDAYGLQSLAFNARSAGDEAGRWIVLRNGAKLSKDAHQVWLVVSSTLTLSSVSSGLGLNAPILARRTSNVDGYRVEQLSGDSATQSGPPPAREVLYVMAKGSPLIVQADTTATGLNVKVDFSHWGQVPSLHAPEAAAAFQAAWLAQK